MSAGMGTSAAWRRPCPAGFAYVSTNGLPGGAVAVSGQELTFTLLDEKNFHLHGDGPEHGGPPFLQWHGDQ